MLRRLRRVPLPLGLLLVIATIQALAWIVLMPPFQGPDEESHFTYIQRTWERHTIPWRPQGGEPGGQSPYSQEVHVALSEAGFGPLEANIAARPLWTRADEKVWSRVTQGADRGNGGITSALRNPPLYYLYDTIPYGVGSGGTIFDRELLTRLGNIPLYLVGLVFAWLLAGELFNRRRSLQFVTTAVAATVPQLTNVVATVNPDSLLIALSSAALYLMTLVVRRGARRNLVIPLIAVVVAAGFTQPRGIPLVFPAAMAIILALARERGWAKVTPLRLGAAVLALYVLTTFVLAARTTGSVREFGSYVWQFYLPRLSFMNPTIGPSGYDVHSGFVERLFGSFAQLEVGAPATVADIAWDAARVGLVLLVVVLIVKRDAVRRNLGVVVVLGTAVWTLILGLHLVAYRAMLATPGDPVVTGRYLLPLLALLGAAVALIGELLPRRIRPGYAGLVAAAGVAVQLISLGLLLERFYA